MPYFRHFISPSSSSSGKPEHLHYIIHSFVQHSIHIQQIELLDSQLERVEAEMTEIMKFNDSVIMTIPSYACVFRIAHSQKYSA